MKYWMQSDSVAASALIFTENQDFSDLLKFKKNNDTFCLQCKCGVIDKEIK